MNDKVKQAVEEAKASSNSNGQQRSQSQQPKKVEPQGLFDNPVEALAELFVTPQLQAAFNHEVNGRLARGWEDNVCQSADKKKSDSDDFRERVEQQKGKLLEARSQNLDEMAKRQAEAELGYYNMGSQFQEVLQLATPFGAVAALNGSR